MLKISKITVENMTENCVTDCANPRISFSLESDKKDVVLETAVIAVGGWEKTCRDQIAIPYGGEPLKPCTRYEVSVEATDNYGERAESTAFFETGKLTEAWTGKWITDGSYVFKGRKNSPIPMTFSKRISLKKKISEAKIYATAIGIYELMLNGEKVGKDYFMPGFTSYKHNLQYQAYDITDMLREENVLLAVVGGGWAVGAYVYSRRNRYVADRQAFLAEIHIHYEDGTQDVIATDENWQVTTQGNFRYAEFYDGEVYDASISLDACLWRPAVAEKLRIHPKLTAQYGAPVRSHEIFHPISCKKSKSGMLIYDMGQNFAGVISAKIQGKAGQTVVFRHAEVLNAEGELFTEFLRSAKQTVRYTCVEGEQDYSPRMTYMGFRYVGVEGIEPKDIELTGLALYSDIAENGSFSCSNELINKLQSNICWSGKSNFVDIPTDCPQRDERLGWTGDLALFAPTAAYNFDMSRFLDKWLLDVKTEQRESGGIPTAVPTHGHVFPVTFPICAVDFWGDACILVPWAEYMARGDMGILRRNYPVMKKYLKACTFWAGLFSSGKRKYIWGGSDPVNKLLANLHYGDWVAPDIKKFSVWTGRYKWTATASLKNCSGLLSKIAGLLGETEDEKIYAALSEKVSDAFESILTDGKGKIYNGFQTAYVLAIYYGMFRKNVMPKAVDRLVSMIKEGDYRIMTGFPGTPYILFALADNGRTDEAFRMLLNEKCPSWLYEVRSGATTIWEKWDAMDENGLPNAGKDGTDTMISFNHYAFGSVGDFLYKRIAGIEAETGGYRNFRIKPVLGGNIENVTAAVNTPFGKIEEQWTLENNVFSIRVGIPVGSTCHLVMPSGETHTLGSGLYQLEERVG